MPDPVEMLEQWDGDAPGRAERLSRGRKRERLRQTAQTILGDARRRGKQGDVTQVAAGSRAPLRRRRARAVPARGTQAVAARARRTVRPRATRSAATPQPRDPDAARVRSHVCGPGHPDSSSSGHAPSKTESSCGSSRPSDRSRSARATPLSISAVGRPSIAPRSSRTQPRQRFVGHQPGPGGDDTVRQGVANRHADLGAETLGSRRVAGGSSAPASGMPSSVPRAAARAAAAPRRRSAGGAGSRTVAPQTTWRRARDPAAANGHPPGAAVGESRTSRTTGRPIGTVARRACVAEAGTAAAPT